MSQALSKVSPSSSGPLPYGRQWIEDEDLAAVAAVLQSDWLTTGPMVARFEEAVAAFTGARHGVAVANGTAALHAAMYAAGIGAGDEVIVPPMTFAATANAVVFQGGRPVFADVDGETLLLDPAAAEARITPKTRAIVAVDYAGQPCDYRALRAVADRHGLTLVADGCHALGATAGGRRVGTLADLTVFSFHPVKHITTGEGGMVMTGRGEWRERMAAFRNHGIDTDHRQRAERGSWFYEMRDLGYNYRLSDLQCALGLSQLSRLPGWLARRRGIAAAYGRALADLPWIRPVAVRADVEHAYHLYPVRVRNRARVFARLREAGIGANVHYVPVHLHPYYRERFGTGPGLCPAAEAAYEELLSLPMFPAMSDGDVERVVEALDAIGDPR
jgi:perosamine synthetase